LDAKKSSDEKAHNIIALRDQLKVGIKDLQSGHLQIQKIYERDRQGNQREFKHFQVKRNFTIVQRDVKRFDEFLSQLVSSTDMEVNFSFESSRYHDIRSETRLKAIGIARKKAADMTEALDAKLGRVMMISEHHPEIWRGSPLSNAAFVNPASAAPEDVAAGTFAPGAIEIRVSVNVKFEIE
jgi:uncharacterized protein YggE